MLSNDCDNATLEHHLGITTPVPATSQATFHMLLDDWKQQNLNLFALFFCGQLPREIFMECVSTTILLLQQNKFRQNKSDLFLDNIWTISHVS